jgi:hypothetical protein
MKNPDEVNLRSFRRWWRLLPISVLFLGMSSALLVLYVAFVNDERQRTYFVLADAVADIQIETATAHLWLEEALTAGPDHIDIREVLSNLDEAIAASQAILTGGEVRHGRILSPLNDRNLRPQAEKIKTLLAEIKALTVKRYNNRAATGIGTTEDKSYNALFRDLMKKADQLHGSLIGSQGRSYLFWRQVFWGVLLVWTFIVNIAAVALWSQQTELNKRIAACEAESAG